MPAVEQKGWQHLALRQLRLARQVVDLGGRGQDEQGVQPVDAAGAALGLVAVDVRALHAARPAGRPRAPAPAPVSSSTGPNWIESVGHDFAQAGSRPSFRRS